MCLFAFACNSGLSKLDITYIDGYLPKERVSTYKVEDVIEGEYFVRDESGTLVKINPIGIKYVLTEEYYGNYFSVKSIDEESYVLEQNHKYYLNAFIVAKYSDSNDKTIFGLHPYSLNTMGKYKWNLIVSDNVWVNGREISPREIGNASVRLDIGEYSFESKISVNKDGFRKKTIYNIKFVVDNSFIGTSMNKSYFKSGDYISIAKDGPDSSYYIIDGTTGWSSSISINGLSYNGSNEFRLPSMDVLVEYSNYCVPFTFE